MLARTTTVVAQQSLIDAGVEKVRDEIMPTLLDTAGCVGLSMLVERASGYCIVTTAWQTEEALRTGETAPVRERIGALLGGRPDVEDWEIAVLHRDHASRPGACVRTTWVRIEPDQADRAVDLYKLVLLPEIREFDGFCSASLLLDRRSGHTVSSVTFDSHEAMRQTRRLAAVVRERGAREAVGEILEVSEFELALAHLRVPELV